MVDVVRVSSYYLHMIDVDIQKLAGLSRIEVSNNEQVQLKKELPAILQFVEQIRDAGGEIKKETSDHYNVFREDTNPHAGGVYTKELLDAMPKKTDDGYLKVRKIITQD